MLEALSVGKLSFAFWRSPFVYSFYVSSIILFLLTFIPEPIQSYVGRAATKATRIIFRLEDKIFYVY